MTDNELIARFMGCWQSEEYYFYNPQFEKAFIVSDMLYNVSWDWLMLVVEKVNVLSNDNFSIGQKIVNHGRLQFNADSTIAAVYKAVIHFIKWYNQNN